ACGRHDDRDHVHEPLRRFSHRRVRVQWSGVEPRLPDRLLRPGGAGRARVGARRRPDRAERARAPAGARIRRGLTERSSDARQLKRSRSPARPSPGPRARARPAPAARRDALRDRGAQRRDRAFEVAARGSRAGELVTPGGERGRKRIAIRSGRSITMSTPRTGAVFAQTNDAAANAVVAFPRAEDGTLSRTDSYPTGGLGNGVPHLPSQGSVVLAAGRTRLLVANAGSNDVSVFALSGDGLGLV